MISTTAINTQDDQGLSIMDIRALREATSVSLLQKDGIGTIIARKSLAKPTPWEHEREYRINCATRVKTNYRYDEATEARIVCYTVLYPHGDTAIWQTIVGMLKSGDIIHLEWLADVKTNGYLERASLHGDRVDLVVIRNKRVFRFILDVSICQNNTARMIRGL